MVPLLVALTIVVCLIVDAVVQRRQARSAAASHANATSVPLRTEGLSLGSNPFQIPKGLFFHPGHTWVALHRLGKVRVGVDDFSQRVIGPIDGLKVRGIGEKVKQGDDLLSIKQGERVAKFTSPVDGVIVAVNDEALLEPSRVQQDPYDKGWVYLISPTSLATNLRRMKIAEEALTWLQQEIRRFQEFVRSQLPQHATVGPTLQDGGFTMDGLLTQMDDETWHEFESQFLRSSEE